MPRQINRLTSLQVARLNKPGLHPDGNNLYLSVAESGAKSWRMIYTFAGKRRELGLGSTTVVSLAAARVKALEGLALRREGRDPKLAWKTATSGVPAFGEAALDFIDGREAGWKNAKHQQQWRNTLTTYAKPIWEIPVSDIGVDDILRVLRPIWVTKAETAKRLRGRIESVLDAAKVRGHRSGENPATWRGNLALLLPKQRKGPKQHHPAMPFEAVPAFMVRLAQREALSARALELTILTAARTSEALQASWDEFDLNARLWIIPADRMKAGKEHRVPLSPQALDLLESLPRVGPFVFPGLKPGKPLSNMSMEMVLRRMEVTDCSVHGFRSSFRDWCGEETAFPRDIAEMALAHAVGSDVERAYRRGDALEKRRELMAQWGAYATSLNPKLNPKD
ncbi:integrase arm-type DNA-binding domain-containing protein [Sphingomonas sp.]|uniref:tyrosine-type recombinase/integrase n=1 Tax=Sphingomonas sp. TaxID=28214 RepID=UPI00307EBB4A